MEVVSEQTMVQKNEPIINGTVKQYGSKLFGFIRSKVNSNEDAEDLLQDVWSRFSQLTNLDELESVSGWLYQVARNRVTDFYRKKKTGRVEDFSFESENGEIDFKQLLLSTEDDLPEMKQFRNLFWEQLLSALDDLPENQREVFVLNEMEDLTLQQIADQTGENLKTIISRKGYAVKFLRQRLETLYNEFINT